MVPGRLVIALAAPSRAAREAASCCVRTVPGAIRRRIPLARNFGMIGSALTSTGFSNPVILIRRNGSELAEEISCNDHSGYLS